MFNPIQWFNSLPESKQLEVRKVFYLMLEIVMLWCILMQTIIIRKLTAEYKWLQTHCTQTDVGGRR